MSRFSVEKNMIPLDQISNSVSGLLNEQLTFPNTFDKFTIGLDRDGVLNELGGIINSAEKFIPVINSMRAVAIIRSKGHKICILHDQPLISQKKLTIAEVEALNQHMLVLLGQAGCISIDGIYYNTSTKKEDIYAKPKIGLMIHAENTIAGIKFKGGAYVGDSIEDLVMAERAGAIPVLVLTGNGRRTLEKLKSPIYMSLKSKVQIYETLLEYALSLS
jgi:D-glycero-D-manno-heptose 1,7-bisphosphate phosphatase